MVALAKNIKSKKTTYAYGNYLDEVWTLDKRSGGITVADLNENAVSGSADRHFYHCNTLYSVYGLTDEAANVVESYMYDSYGRQTVVTDGLDADAVVNFNANDVHTLGGNSLIGNPWMYTGQRLDAETGLGYHKNRYFSFDFGRFLNRNLWGYIQGRWNLYDYAMMRPTWGLEPTSAVSVPLATAPWWAPIAAEVALGVSVAVVTWILGTAVKEEIDSIPDTYDPADPKPKPERAKPRIRPKPEPNPEPKVDLFPTPELKLDWTCDTGEHDVLFHCCVYMRHTSVHVIPKADFRTALKITIQDYLQIPKMVWDPCFKDHKTTTNLTDENGKNLAGNPFIIHTWIFIGEYPGKCYSRGVERAGITDTKPARLKK